MNETIGKRLAELRREKRLDTGCGSGTSGGLPSSRIQMGNDASCPDILMLPRIADLFGVTIDELFGRRREETRLVAEEDRPPADKQLLKIRSTPPTAIKSTSTSLFRL